MLSNTKLKELFDEAMKVHQNAYAPYSGFSVGAALLTKTGKVYKGCNVENVTLSPGNCAERVAIQSAIAEGEKEFTDIFIVADQKISPCGVCRQVLFEFAPKLNVHFAKANIFDDISSYELSELLPEAALPLIHKSKK